MGGVDVLVVGGGHAGCEAASAAARLGAKVTLVTTAADAIARMSCNPAIGGVGKGHLVTEIDALGGLMGRAADRAGIQFRVLNRSQGPAVHGIRCQTDKEAYATWMRRELGRFPNITIVEAEVSAFHVERGVVAGVRVLDGEAEVILSARAVVLTAGTFLGARLHVGKESTPGGRIGEAPSNRLPEAMRGLGFRLRRFKTGTPARIDRNTIDVSRMAEQTGDPVPALFSWRHRNRKEWNFLPQASCHLTRTSEETHEIVRRNLGSSPLFLGRISGRGPRYCPSLEDKVVRFSERASHQIFVEPEGLATDSMYLNGLSTSLPAEVQMELLRSIPGLERARVLRFGYAVEYDFLDPTELGGFLEVRSLPGLWLAGQVNGTSGYEEAAAQGLVAGANAALCALEREPFALSRDEAYIGVLVDDLVRNGTDEPYRMFTSRAEYRLLLGSESAVARLLPKALGAGLIPEWERPEAERRLKECERADALADTLRETPVFPDRETIDRFVVAGSEPPTERTTAWDLLRRPVATLSAMARAVPELSDAIHELHPDERKRLESDALYSGYRTRLQRQAELRKNREAQRLPGSLEFGSVPGLSAEMVERFSSARPATLGAASRVRGVTPAAIEALEIEIERRRRQA